VTTQFLNSLCTSIACTAFSRSTAAFRIIVLPFSETNFWQAVELKAHHAMSYADCFAAAAAIQEQATLLTSDPEFETVRHLITIAKI
jgi:predicted nucleic acid-binding protein